jgi:hypothetical protein
MLSDMVRLANKLLDLALLICKEHMSATVFKLTHQLDLAPADLRARRMRVRRHITCRQLPRMIESASSISKPVGSVLWWISALAGNGKWHRLVIRCSAEESMMPCALHQLV